MRHFIDVIFINPKKRHYVILHKGEFWQLPRMNLSLSAWLCKSKYQDALADIFVAKNQAIDCSDLRSTIKTHHLPSQLAGVDAQRFLAWWQRYRRQWNSKTPCQDSNTDTIADNTPKQSEIIKTAFDDKPSTNSPVVKVPIIKTTNTDKTTTNPIQNQPIFDDLLKQLNDEILYNDKH